MSESALQDRILALKQEKEVQPKLGRFETLKTIYEKQLRKHVKNNRLMPVTRKEFSRLAFDLTESLNNPHRFNREKQMAGKNFFSAFKKRNPELTLRTPESTSVMRAV